MFEAAEGFGYYRSRSETVGSPPKRRQRSTLPLGSEPRPRRRHQRPPLRRRNCLIRSSGLWREGTPRRRPFVPPRSSSRRGVFEGTKKGLKRRRRDNVLALLLLMIRCRTGTDPRRTRLSCQVCVQGRSIKVSHLFDGDGSPAADAVGSGLQTFLILVRIAGLPRLWTSPTRPQDS